MSPCLRPEIRKKKRCACPKTGPKVDRLGKACSGPPIILSQHPNNSPRRFLREMALEALDPQTLNIGKLVPLKRTFDNLEVL